MQSRAPWDLNKLEDEERINKVIYLCIESIRICGILLQPYMPAKMTQLLDMLGVADDSRVYSKASLGSDLDYGQSTSSAGNYVLFPPLSSHF